MTLPLTHETTLTSLNLNGSAEMTTSNSMNVGKTPPSKIQEGASPASSSSDCGTKRPLDWSAASETDTRAKRARKMANTDDSPAGALLVGLPIIESTPIPVAPSFIPNTHNPPQGAEVVMDREDTIDQAGGTGTNSEEDVMGDSMISRLPHLPLDVLAEILCFTGHPGDILAVARTCKQLCTQLVSLDASFIWRKARTAVGLPDPQAYNAKVKNLYESDGSPKCSVGVGCFVGREPAYAAFVFDNGICEACGKSTDRMYVSFALRLRLCNKPECRKQAEETFSPAYLTWLPVIECSYIFQQNRTVITWPKTTLTRKSLLTQAEYHEFSTSRADNAVVQRMNLAIARNNIWMQFCLSLYRWRTSWESRMRHIEQSNETKGKSFADTEGWDYLDMLANTSYGQFHSGKCKRREKIEDEELEGMRPTIARELLQSQEKKHWKAVTKLRQTNFNSVWKFYQKLMSQPENYPYLPPFSFFLQFPAVQLLQSSDLATAEISVKTAVNGKTFMKGMIKQQIDNWAEGVKREMLETLGGSSEWNRMVPAHRMPHPVLHLNARWKCKVCNSVERIYEIDECLDFAGVCHHQCPEKDGMKRRKGAATQAWSTSNFVKDEQAYAVMTTCLEHIGVKAETVEETNKRFLGTAWRCLSCDPPLFVRSGCIIGHSHRHPVPMKIELIEAGVVSTIRPRPNLTGLAEWLMQGSKGAREWTSKSFYGCQHCANAKGREGQSTKVQPMPEDGSPTHPEPQEASKATRSGAEKTETNVEKAQGNDNGKKKQSENKFDFNGLRSHLSSKHKIYQIRDEDFYCHGRIKFPRSDTLENLLDFILYDWNIAH